MHKTLNKESRQCCIYSMTQFIERTKVGKGFALEGVSGYPWWGVGYDCKGFKGGF